MRITFIPLLISLLASSFTFANEQTAKILVLGDSLSAAYGISQDQGWVALLQQRLDQENLNYQIINASISGETTAGGRSRLPDLLQQHQPQWLLLALGANDGLRGLSLRAMRSNLNEMIEKAQQQQTQVVMIGMRIPSNYGAAYTDAFFQTFAKLAKAEDTAAYVPFLLERIATDMSWFQADGLHPTAAAQPHILETVWTHVSKVLKTSR